MVMHRIPPGPGQESVWDYPRPPRVELSDRTIEVVLAGVTVARTSRAWRVLETSHPPVYYIPLEDIMSGCLHPEPDTSFCEWKGRTREYTVVVGDRRAEHAAWSYPDPTPAFRPIAHHVAFYAGPMDGCYVDGERVEPQPGNYYGGWITKDITGPFKGPPGTHGW